MDMGIRRFFQKLYYSRSRGVAFIGVILFVIAGYLFISRHLNEKHLSKTTAITQHDEIDSKHKISEQKDEKDTLQLPETSLKVKNEQFYLNGEPFTILGGSIHYFRVVPQYWEDRLTKLKALGLNTVTTCIPWTFHEEFKDFIKFDQQNYDIVSFVELAHKLGLHVILRPGPYIDAQMDFGGLPSWLMHDNNVKLRSSDPVFFSHVEKYFKHLLAALTPFQYSNGGPIIAWQIEHKFTSFGDDSAYMNNLHKLMIDNGVRELMFTTETWTGLLQNRVNPPEVLKGVSMEFLVSEKDFLEDLKKKQPGKPLFVTEFWIGDHDHWSHPHSTISVDTVAASLARILAMGASVNFYLFHGGTNFGFISGADNGEKFEFSPMVTSFDCDALLNEAGDVTHKYKELRKVLKAHAPEHSFPKKLPEIPPDITRKAYGSVKMKDHIPLQTLYKSVGQRIEIKEIVPMEQLNINKNGGQREGFIVYRTKIPVDAKKLFIEKYRDWAQVLVASELVATLDTMNLQQMEMDIGGMMNIELDLKHKSKGEDGYVYLDILVENLGRGSLHLDQSKGLIGEVLIDGKPPPKSWTVFPFSFHKHFLTGVFHETQWDSTSDEKHKTVLPGYFKGALYLTNKPRDTFLDMSDWGKGVVFLNDRVVGRYWSIGPQQSLYVPSVWLQPGENTIVILELLKQSEGGVLKFSKDPILDKTKMSKEISDTQSQSEN